MNSDLISEIRTCVNVFVFVYFAVNASIIFNVVRKTIITVLGAHPKHEKPHENTREKFASDVGIGQTLTNVLSVRHSCP